MKYKRHLVVFVTIFTGFAINCLIFINYSSVYVRKMPFGGSAPVNLDVKYLISNQQCSKGKPQPNIVLLVTSFSGNIETRDAIRRAYPVKELQKLNIVRVFLLAKLRKGQSRVSYLDIVHESSRYGDILLGDFYEAYRNLTYKHLMGLKWASEMCKSARYIAKMDDDIVVYLYKLIEIISMEEKVHNITLMGYLMTGEEVTRNRTSKWYVTKSEYYASYYPPYIVGLLYVTSPATASLLVSTARTAPFFWVDDVYITGLLAWKANVPHQEMNHYISRTIAVTHCCIRDTLFCNYVAGHSNGSYAMHGSFKRLNDDCERGFCKTLPPGESIYDYCIINRGKFIIQQIQ